MTEENSIWQKNKEALFKKNENFTNFILNNKPIEWIQKIKSGTGDLNLSIKTDYGYSLVYDNKNPRKKAIDESEELDFHQDAVTIILGFGCGYLAQEILKKSHDKHHVVIVDPVLDFHKIAFGLFDYSEYIESGKLLFAVNKDDILFHLHSFEQIKSVEQYYLLTEDYIKIRKEYYDFHNYTTKIINQIQCNTGTIIGAGEKIALNDIESLPYVIRHRGVNELKNLYKRKPAICVATGPSLQKNIHLLRDKSVQDRFIIIAVGQALRVLLAYDIVPDFITSVDFGEVNMSHYADLLDSEVPLVALNRSYAPLLKNWEKHKFICTSLNPGFDNTACGLLQQKGHLEQGGSVAHLSVSLAKLLGCDPITIIGQDLAYEDEKSHIEQVDTGGKLRVENGELKWDVDDPSSIIKEGTHNMGVVQYVPGYFGKQVLTSQGFLAFLLNFETIFLTSKSKIINATEGGAKINFSDQMLLQDVIEKYGVEKIDKSKIKDILSLVDNHKELTAKAYKLLKDDIKHLDDIIDSTTKALEYCDKLKTDKTKKNLLKQFEYTKKAQELVSKHPLIPSAIYGIRRLISQRQMFVDVDGLNMLDKKHKDKFDKRVKRTVLILTTAKESAEKFKEAFQDVYEVIGKYESGDIDILKSDTEPLPNLDQCEDYLSVKNFANPLMKCRKFNNRTIHDKNLELINNIEDKALELRNKILKKSIDDYKEVYEEKKQLLEYNRLIEEGQKIGRDEKDFNKALEYLLKADECSQVKDKTLCWWGIATTYRQLDNFDKCIEYFKKLLSLHPDNLDWNFELMQVYLEDARLNEAIKIYQTIVEITDKFDYFYKIFSQIYFSQKQYQSALDCIDQYLNKFNFDISALELKKEILIKLGRGLEIKGVDQKIRGLIWS